mmetsp:Transcript_125437/g.360450  ORF Transcript_125437/g.360450 Transcript_125437/m.360450 type:complete len:452 (+) Transcript_125437:721-2076(+)
MRNASRARMRMLSPWALFLPLLPKPSVSKFSAASQTSMWERSSCTRLSFPRPAVARRSLNIVAKTPASNIAFKSPTSVSMTEALARTMESWSRSKRPMANAKVRFESILPVFNIARALSRHQTLVSANFVLSMICCNSAEPNTPCASNARSAARRTSATVSTAATWDNALMAIGSALSTSAARMRTSARTGGSLLSMFTSCQRGKRPRSKRASKAALRTSAAGSWSRNKRPMNRINARFVSALLASNIPRAFSRHHTFVSEYCALPMISCNSAEPNTPCASNAKSAARRTSAALSATAACDRALTAMGSVAKASAESLRTSAKVGGSLLSMSTSCQRCKRPWLKRASKAASRTSAALSSRSARRKMLTDSDTARWFRIWLSLLMMWPRMRAARLLSASDHDSCKSRCNSSMRVGRSPPVKPSTSEDLKQFAVEGPSANTTMARIVGRACER